MNQKVLDIILSNKYLSWLTNIKRTANTHIYHLGIYQESFAVDLKYAMIFRLPLFPIKSSLKYHIMQILWWWRGGGGDLGEKMKKRKKEKRGN